MARLVFEAGELAAKHPPRLGNANKRVVYDVALQDGLPFQGTVVYTRWPARDLPESVEIPGRTAVEVRGDVYDYEPALKGAPALEWHVNFADPKLFFGYGSGLFAQDEIQAAEHPALGCLREALLARGEPAVTVEGGEPTPVLVRGVERRVAVNTAPSPERPEGLYGNRFAVAPAEVVRAAAKPVAPPTVSNIVAMAAPSGGFGTYKRDEIRSILVTACTAFAAARQETADATGEDALTAVHTGWWGCGAFGGNRLLMAALQVLAAGMADIDRLIFHAVDSAGIESFRSAQDLLRAEFAEGRHATADILDRLTAQRFPWGISDGN